MIIKSLLPSCFFCFCFGTVICIHSKLISRLIRHADYQRRYPKMWLLHTSTPLCSLLIDRQYWISNWTHRVCIRMNFSVCVTKLSITPCRRATRTSKISCMVALTLMAWLQLGLQKPWTQICKPFLVSYCILW